VSDCDYIEVTGSALIVRTIETHRASINISVTTKKAVLGAAMSLRLRDQVIQALKSVGVAESSITDGGCSLGHSTWSSNKQLTHELSIQTQETQIFVSAMSAIEQVFTEARTGYFSGTQNEFSFKETDPIYAKTEEANELAIREAIKNAVGKAHIIAEQAGLELGSIVAVNELIRPRRKLSTPFGAELEDPMDFDAHLAVRGRGYSMDSDSFDQIYTEVAPRKTTGIVELRVRFSIAKIS
jgi:hypothetical protein